MRLILLSSASATLSIGIPQLTGAAVGSIPVDSSSFWLHTVLLPGLSIVVQGAAALSGVAGILAIETNRGRIPLGAQRAWDSARLMALLAILSGGVLFVSGIALGFAYVADHGLWIAIRLAAWAAVGLGVGLYLLWTAERIESAGLLGPVALAFGIVSIALAAAISAASRFGATIGDSAASTLLVLATSVTAMLSLLAWIAVFAGVLGRFRRKVGPSSVVGGA